MAKPIHMMVRVADEARSVDFYSKAFGLKVADRVDFPNFTLIYMRGPQNDFEVELTVNKGRDEPYKLGDTRAVMLEGPSREALELVEVK